MKTTTLLYIAKAEENRAIAHEIGESSAAHRGWQITLLFYSALFWIRAYFAESEIPDTPSHYRRMETVRGTAEVSNIAPYFADLQDLSEEARYELPEKDAVDLSNAQKDYESVRARIVHLIDYIAPIEGVPGGDMDLFDELAEH